VLDEDYFQSDWPAGLRIVDNRDMMHKRGWTYFRVTGRMNRENVYGVGRIPFVYATSKRYSPWLKLRIEDNLRIADSGTNACVYDRSGKVTARYEGGSFFKGLGRPWMGLHTVDTVRRDAAEQLVRFDTELGSDSNKVQVILNCEQVKLIYTIDLKTDVIDEITFSAQESIKGQLRFSYLQDIDGVGNEFARPTRQSSQKRQKESKGLLWLVQLTEGSLGK
jgi:hypothetical protein